MPSATAARSTSLATSSSSAPSRPCRSSSASPRSSTGSRASEDPVRPDPTGWAGLRRSLPSMVIPASSVRSVSVALATAVVATTGTAAGAAERAATAAGPCTYAHLSVQPKVELSVPYRTLPATVTTDCQDFDYVTDTWDSWSGMAGGAVQGTVI